MSDTKPSGAEFRRRRKLQAEEAARNEAARRADRKAASRAPLAYSAIEPPDLGDTASMVRYGAQVLAVVMDQTMLDPDITEEQRRRELRDGAAKLGMIRDKAAEQEAIKKSLRMRQGKQETTGLEDASQFAEPRVSRPPG